MTSMSADSCDVRGYLPMAHHGYEAIRKGINHECPGQQNSSPAMLQYLEGTL